MKAYIVSEAGKFVSSVATTGYYDTSVLKDEIKSMVNQAMETVPPSSSSTEGELRALATKADFLALGDLYLTNLDSIVDELSS